MKKFLDSFKNLQTWQKRKLTISLLLLIVIGVTYITYAAVTLYNDRVNEDSYWTDSLALSEEMQAIADERSADAIQVNTGTYMENLKEINMKSSSFRSVFQIWFRWEGDPDLDPANNFKVYKGAINKIEMIKDYHEGNVNYQLVRVDATVTKNFWTKRFPLESHQLRMYLESNYPIEEVVFVNDDEHSGTNPNLSIQGFDLKRFDTGTYGVIYENNHNDPELKDSFMSSEYVIAMEINRSSWGLYAKCFIALVGTITWVLITLYINTYHRVDPLGMIPAALFGTVSNIMVGANLLPDALSIGLLEYVNIFGVMTIMAVTISVININRIRNAREDKEFAHQYGSVMFFTILTLTLLGHIIMPVISYMF